MRVLGIDPGLTRCGIGVVDGEVGRPLTLVDVNVLRTSSSEPVAIRLVTIEKGVDAWLDEYRPDAVAVERVFARSDVSTVMGTAQASGIAMVCAARRGLPVALHTPSEVKAAVSGSGRADKAQVGAMVTRILRLIPVNIVLLCHHLDLASQPVALFNQTFPKFQIESLLLVKLALAA